VPARTLPDLMASEFVRQPGEGDAMIPLSVPGACGRRVKADRGRFKVPVRPGIEGRTGLVHAPPNATLGLGGLVPSGFAVDRLVLYSLQLSKRY